jgi:hypothetical protein
MLKRNEMQRKLAGDASLVHYGHRQAISVAWLLGQVSDPFIGNAQADDACETYRNLCLSLKVDPSKKWVEA